MADLLQHLDSPSVLRELVEAGADVSVTDGDGANALHLIAAESEPVLESAQILFDAGTPLNALDNRLRTPLFRAVYEGASTGTVAWLLDHGAAVDMPGVRYTPLQAASYWSQTNIMLLLLQAGADPNISTEEAPIPPLVQAMGSEHGLLESVTLLLAFGADPAFAGHGNQTPLARGATFACSERNQNQDKIAVLFLLFDAVDQRGTLFSQEVIDEAFSNCSMNYIHDVFVLFLERGANVNSQIGNNPHGEYTRALILASGTEHISPDNISFLIRHGADLTLTDVHLRGPLHAAARNGVLTAMEPLLNAGVVVDQPDDRGRTALHEACDCYNQIVKGQATLQSRADIFMSGSIDPATMSERDKRSYELLVESLESKQRERERQLRFIERLVEAGASLTAQDNEGATAMHFASASGDLDLVLLLQRAPRGRYVIVDNSGKTPLHWAAENGAANVIKAMISMPSTELAPGVSKTSWIEWILSKVGTRLGYRREIVAHPVCFGAFSRRILPRVSDTHRRQALHLAAAAGKENVIEALLERPDLPLETVDRDGKSPLQLATEQNHLGCIVKIRVALRKKKEAREYELRMEKWSYYFMYSTAVCILGIAIVVAMLLSKGNIKIPTYIAKCYPPWVQKV